MTLLAIIVPMICLMVYGKKIKTFTSKHYLIAALVALLQVSIVAFKMFTMEKPPLF